MSVDEPASVGEATFTVPLFDIEPNVGELARFGFLVPKVDVPVLLTTSVRSGPGEDWGVDLSASGVPQDAGITSAKVTFWGVPDKSSHDDLRGWGCLAEARGGHALEPCDRPVEEKHPPALLTMPASCTGPLSSSVEADSWAAPGSFETVSVREPLAARGELARVWGGHGVGAGVGSRCCRAACWKTNRRM